MLIATRILTLRPDDATGPPADPVAVPVRLHAPEPGPDGGWFCAYEIDWPDEPRRFAGWGADAVQALDLTLKMIALDLSAGMARASGRLVWDGQCDGHGFGDA